uniref:Uncharacterized protein n=1 Tax=Rhizophora mucronata TaxID=61149 RepID=A0A2P2QBE7_RHIMU
MRVSICKHKSYPSKKFYTAKMSRTTIECEFLSSTSI